MNLFKIVMILGIVCLVNSCKKENITKNINHESVNLSKSDTLFINKEKFFISFNWDEKEIENYRKKFQNEDNFYTVMDDINFYTSESLNCLEKINIEKVNVNKKQYKIIAINDEFISTDSIGIFDIILFEKGKKSVIKKPIDGVENCFNYFDETSKKQQISENKSIDFFTPKNYHILTKVTHDWNGDKIEDVIIVYDSIPAGNWEGISKRPLIGLKGKKDGYYEFWFRNDDAIPCRNCSGSADPEFQLLLINDKLTYHDVSLISSNFKDIKYVFDKRLNLQEIKITTEGNSPQQIKNQIITNENIPKTNLKSIVIEDVERKLTEN